MRGTPQDIAEIEGTAAARHGRTPGEVAIAWTLRLPAVTGAIVGAAPATQESFLILGRETCVVENDVGAGVYTVIRVQGRGLSSARMVGMSSETVGCMCTAR